ncbi:MAG TPA: hypothetical protein VN030_05580 [Cellvibrio sp.]|nr:hypothetical protein [Cellvibrio sp.]
MNIFLRSFLTLILIVESRSAFAQLFSNFELPFGAGPIYQPINQTEDLLQRYSQVSSKPNEYWQLTEQEWSLYTRLKAESPWAYWENHSTPTAILAFYTTSIEEKRRYARIEAELDTWRQYSVTEFQSLYDKEREIVHKRYAEYIQREKPSLANIKPYDKLRLFVQVGKCDEHCRSLVSRVLKTQAKTDIYVIGAKVDTDIFSWAESAGIPVERVKTKEVTLNHENGLLQLISNSAGVSLPAMPALFKQFNNSDQLVAI